jgi:hypothetical protein
LQKTAASNDDPCSQTLGRCAAMPAEKKIRISTISTKLAKAETLLILALMTDALVTQWLFTHTKLTPAMKTGIKMLIVVGVFGPLFDMLSKFIDSGLGATREVTGRTFFLGRLGAHALLIGGIFIAFYYNMHQTYPWKNGAAIVTKDIDDANTKPFWSARR